MKYRIEERKVIEITFSKRLPVKMFNTWLKNNDIHPRTIFRHINKVSLLFKSEDGSKVERFLKERDKLTKGVI